MKASPNFVLMLAISASLAACGGEKPEEAPPTAAAETDSPPPAPEFIDSSVFFEVPDLRKKSPEEALAVYAAAEARLAPKDLLAAAKPMLQPESAEHVAKWEAEGFFLEAKHFGQTRFIIVYSGPGTGNRATDKAFLRDLGTALSTHAQGVVGEEITKAASQPAPAPPVTPPPPAP